MNGHIPRYTGTHPDSYIHHTLTQSLDLLHFDARLFDHLRSSLRYSSHALPVNALLDALLRPNGDVPEQTGSCVTWTYEPTRAIDHLAIGDSTRPGGQWANNSLVTNHAIGTLSYAEQLSLPGYTFADYWRATRNETLPELIRPSRTDLAAYLASYPQAVGIADRIKSSERVHGVARSGTGFYIASHDIFCKHLVLASGTFCINLPPPPSLTPLSSLCDSKGPILVIGSGFTAADIIISAPADREIAHIFNWDPENKPSPLKGCHVQAYPEYAFIYRQMKIATVGGSEDDKARQNFKARHRWAKELPSLPSFSRRDWAKTYMGYPNGKASAIRESKQDQHLNLDFNESSKNSLRSTQVAISLPESISPIIKTVSSIQYAAGRRGSLAYLSSPLLREIIFDDGQYIPFTPVSPPQPTQLTSYPSSTAYDPDPWTGESESPPQNDILLAGSAHGANTAQEPVKPTPWHGEAIGLGISGQTLRAKIESTDSVEVATNVFAVGSLTGDSLVRYALGGCCAVAGSIMRPPKREANTGECNRKKRTLSSYQYDLCDAPNVCVGEAAGQSQHFDDSNGASTTVRDFHNCRHYAQKLSPDWREAKGRTDIDASSS